MGTLKALATLIDWNDINLFDSCRAKITEFLREKQLRAGAFTCLGAIVGKGMPTVIDKLTMIHKTGYSDEVNNASFTLLQDYENNHDTDDYEEEKAYMQAVSDSVSHMGKWCLGLLNPISTPSLV